MSTVTNQGDLPAEECNDIDDKVTACSTSKPDGTNCPPATKNTPATHICYSEITENCQIFGNDQFNYMRTLEEQFTDTEKPSDKPIDWDKQREALHAVSNYTKACRDKFNKVSSPDCHCQYTEACADPRAWRE
jgi:hypothetical protein